MGCDGGTIPKRDELVKTKKKPEQKDKTSELSFRWQHCALTQLPLQQPVVACEMGRLYSKEAVIEALLDKSEENGLKEVAPHIQGLKDVKVISLTDNPAWEESLRGEHGDVYIDVQKAKWICPLTGMEMNGRFRFSFLWSCGCVFSEKALKEMVKVKEEGNECPKCQKPFKFLDIVTLNPTEERDIEILEEKINLRRTLAKEAKANKKGKKRTAAEAVSTNGESSSSSTEALGSEKVENGTPKEKPKSKLAGKEKPEKKPKIVDPVAAAAAKGVSSSYTVSNDPKASEVYKSLFTSHHTHAQQTRAHWVIFLIPRKAVPTALASAELQN